MTIFKLLMKWEVKFECPQSIDQIDKIAQLQSETWNLLKNTKSLDCKTLFLTIFEKIFKLWITILKKLTWDFLNFLKTKAKSLQSIRYLGLEKEIKFEKD